MQWSQVYQRRICRKGGERAVVSKAVNVRVSYKARSFLSSRAYRYCLLVHVREPLLYVMRHFFPNMFSWTKILRIKMLRSTNLICWCFAIWCVFNKYDLLTHSMVQSPPWEANWFAASQEIPRISRNPKVHYRTHKPPPTFSILDQPNPVYIPTSNLLEIRTNIIQPSTPRSPQWSLSYRLPHQDRIHLPLLTHMHHIHMFTILTLILIAISLLVSS